MSPRWRLSPLSSYINILLSAIMLLLMLRADNSAERQEAVAFENSRALTAIAMMMADFVALQREAVVLQKSDKIEDKQRLASVEKEMTRLTDDIRAARRRVAEAGKPASETAKWIDEVWRKNADNR